MDSKELFDRRFMPVGEAIASSLHWLSLDLCGLIASYVQCSFPTPNAKPLTRTSFATAELCGLLSFTCSPDGSVWLTDSSGLAMCFSVDGTLIRSLPPPSRYHSSAAHLALDNAQRTMFFLRAMRRDDFEYEYDSISVCTLAAEHIRDIPLPSDAFSSTGQIAVHKGDVWALAHTIVRLTRKDERFEAHAWDSLPFSPSSFAISPSDDVYVVPVYTANGTLQCTIANSRIRGPRGVCVDAVGNVLLCCEQELLWISLGPATGACTTSPTTVASREREVVRSMEIITSFVPPDDEQLKLFGFQRSELVDVCIDADNRVFVCDLRGRVVVIAFE